MLWFCFYFQLCVLYIWHACYFMYMAFYMGITNDIPLILEYVEFSVYLTGQWFLYEGGFITIRETVLRLYRF